MYVAACELDLRLTGGPRSLKEKRMVVRSLKDRIKHRFEVSIAEVGAEDLWQRCVMGVACVSGHEGIAQSIIQRVIEFLHQSHEVEIISSHIQVF